MKIENIPTEQWYGIIRSLVDAGWQRVYSLEGVAGSVDYQELHLMKNEIRLKFVWDNWMEGEIWADTEIEELRALL